MLFLNFYNLHLIFEVSLLPCVINTSSHLCDFTFNYMRYLFYLDIFLEMKYKKFILKDFPNDNFPEDTTCFEFIQNAEIAE